MKQVVLMVLVLSLIFGGVAIAQEQSTIVGPVMESRYQAPDPQDKDVAPDEQVQKLIDQGVIPAAEQARLDQQVLQIPKTN